MFFQEHFLSCVTPCNSASQRQHSIACFILVNVRVLGRKCEGTRRKSWSDIIMTGKEMQGTTKETY